jgi:predicted metal-dependent HD superfamily phosphohydrolase
MTGLHESWQRAWSGVGASGDGAMTFAELVRHYSEPHRRYHNLQHLDECIRWFEASSHLAGRPAEVEAALWFHDAIYNLGQADNEEQSANWAETALSSAGVPDDSVARVAQLVLATKHTSLPGS